MATLLLAPVIAGANAFWAAALTMAASALDNWMFAPKQDIKGQRMDSLQLQDSSYGGMISIAFGGVRTAGNIIFATDFVEHEDEENVGKGGKQTMTTYTYTISIAVAVAKGPIARIGRIWADGKIMATDTNKNGYNFRVYYGTEDQMPDPYIEAKNGGAGTTPAYRGIAYVVFQDIELSDFGNRIPQLQFEIFTVDNFVAGYVPNNFLDGDESPPPVVYENTLMRRAVFSGFYEGLELKNCDLSYALFSNAFLSGLTNAVAFEKCNLSSTGWLYTTLSNASFIDCNLNNATFVVLTIASMGVPMPDPQICPSRFIRCSMVYLRIAIGVMHGTYFKDCDMRHVEVENKSSTKGDEINWCYFENCDLQDAHFSRLGNCIFVNCRLHGATVTKSRIPMSKAGEYHSNQFLNCELLNCDFKTPGNGYVDSESMQYPLQSIIAQLAKRAKIQSQLDFALGDKQETSFAIQREYDFFVSQHNRLINEILPFASCDDDLRVYSRYLADLEAKFIDMEHHTYDIVQTPVNIGIFQYVNGYLISEQTTFRSAIEELQAPFLFSVIDDGSQLKFVMLGAEDKVSIPEADFGAAVPGSEVSDKLTITGGDIAELPTQINFNYFDIAKDYQTNTSQSKILWHAEYPNVHTINAQIVMMADRADYTINQVLAQVWTSKTQYMGQLGNKWSGLEPADVIETTVNGIQRSIQITKIDYDGNIVKFEGKEYRAPGKPPAYERPDPIVPPPVITEGLQLHLLDMPNLTDLDTDYGFYAAAAAQKNWKSVYLYVSTATDNASFTFVDNIGYAATIGEALTVLPPGPTEFYDRGNYVDVKLINRTLQSVPEADLLIGRNAALLGEEVLQFAQAELIGEDLYRLSCLLRGRKGTDWAVHTHKIGDRFILLSPRTLSPEKVSLAEIGIRKRYQYKVKGMEEGVDVDFTYRGTCYKPYTVCHVKSARDVAGNLQIGWVRRTRISGDWRDGVDVALGETREKYEVDIIKADDVVRTIKTTESAASYSAAEQMADFGAVQSEIKTRIYQLSDKVGRGYVKEAIL